jgi:hypothetical protein
MLLYYPLSGFLTLFANCIQNPQDSHVYDDLTLMDYVTSYLSPAAVQVTPIPVAGTLIFRELGSVARKFVEKTNLNVTKATKRTRDGGLPKQEVPQVPSYAPPNSSKMVDSFPQSNVNLGTSNSMVCIYFNCHLHVFASYKISYHLQRRYRHQFLTHI